MICTSHQGALFDAECELQHAAAEALTTLAHAGFPRAAVLVVDPQDESHSAMGVESLSPTTLIRLLETQAAKLRALVVGGERGSVITDDDREAMADTLTSLRELDREVLERSSTALTMAAALRSDRPDLAGVFVLLARVAYVLAHEGQRG